MKSKTNRNCLISSKLTSKMLKQFFFYRYRYTCNDKFKLTIDLFFGSFNYLKIKLLICCLFIMDQFIGDRPSLFKVSKFRLKRETHISLTIRWSIISTNWIEKLFSIVLPKVGTNHMFVPTLGSLKNKLTIRLKSLLEMLPYFKNPRIFHRFLELEHVLLFFSFQFSYIKHNFLLKSYLSYNGLLLSF